MKIDGVMREGHGMSEVEKQWGFHMIDHWTDSRVGAQGRGASFAKSVRWLRGAGDVAGPEEPSDVAEPASPPAREGPERIFPRAPLIRFRNLLRNKESGINQVGW